MLDLYRLSSSNISFQDILQTNYGAYKAILNTGIRHYYQFIKLHHSYPDSFLIE
ncbi:hypothetical protein [Chryseobacterium sp.]|uniref:hypothetical protein n=1 Tax=Chryseobacterium sp. TaxID=1871047 RepID=UPI00235592B1|nr:hypothetical protein [Chryseobacterium sp.]